MDRNHGKRTVPSEETQEKEDDHFFPIYSHRSQQDMSAMVSALAQVIGASPNAYQHPPSSDQSQYASSQQNNEQSQPSQNQGMHVHTSYIDVIVNFLSSR